MNLEEVNKKLIEADENNALALTKLMPLELEYQSKLDKLQLSSQRGNFYDREAESRSLIMEDPIYVKYQTAKLDAKIAYQRLDTLKAVSANLRNLSFYEVRG